MIGATPGVGGAHSVCHPLVWMEKSKNALEIGKPLSRMNERMQSNSWKSRSASREMNRRRSSGGGGFARDVEPERCRLAGTIFLGARVVAVG